MEMSRTEIREKLNDIFKLAAGQAVENIESVDENTNLFTDLGLNSVGVLYTVIAIEEFFNIRFDDVGAGDFNTIKDVIDYIEKKL